MMIWSLRSPVSSARFVDWTAEITMHSFRISSEVRPRFLSLFSCILATHELLIQRAAVHADADRPVVIDRHLADRRELLVAAAAGADVARIDPVLVERRGAVREAGQQEMAVVVEVADERRRAARVEHALLDFGDRGCGLGQVDGDAHHLRPRLRQLDALCGRRLRIRRIRHRHRLDDDRRTAADLDVADTDADGFVEAGY